MAKGSEHFDWKPMEDSNLMIVGLLRVARQVMPDQQIEDRIKSAFWLPRISTDRRKAATIMKHVGILAHSVEGAALCLRAFCQEGFRELGPHEHPDVTLDCIALGRSMAAWEEADYTPIRAILAQSAARLAQAGADFFICPDNTAHIALEEPGDDLRDGG